MFKNPIIITGCPRSRTSLVMQILEISGLFLGNVIGATRANPQGQKENREVIDKIVKPELKKHGYDPKGQHPIPPIDFYCNDPERKQKVFSILEKQGLKNDQKWAMKLCKATLNWQGWDAAFPEATWIIVRRNDKDIIKSCMSPKAAFMDKYNTPDGWQWWVNEHYKRFELIQKHCNTYEIDTDKLINKDFTQLRVIIDALDLKWKPDKIEAQIKP